MKTRVSSTTGEVIADPRVRLLGRVAGLPVYLVSGQIVRNELDIDFTQGGNASVYPTYVEPDEIWVEESLKPLDRTATALHEIVERDQMIRYGKTYDDAHEGASANEIPFRRELKRNPPREFDARRVAAAYRAYLKDPERHPVIDRPNDLPRTRRQIERDIEASLSRNRPGAR
jgi:hypothetical protein